MPRVSIKTPYKYEKTMREDPNFHQHQDVWALLFGRTLCTESMHFCASCLRSSASALILSITHSIAWRPCGEQTEGIC